MIDPLLHAKIQEEDIPMADNFPDDEGFDDEDLDRLGFDQQIFDDNFPDEE
jgi:hypothetical protein